MTDPAESRRYLFERIQQQTAETSGHTGVDRISEPVIAALAAVPREKFMAPGDESDAYRNEARAIGHGQTISQPFIVALMTELLALEPTDRVLEIGTGSGYQSAVLAELVGRLYSLETIPTLADLARARLRRLNLRNVEVRTGDGYAGWPEKAPFDAVIVTAAAPEIPSALVAQLRPGGRMVVPVGEPKAYQTLMVVTRGRANGRVETRETLPVSFVPMVPEGGLLT